MDKLTSILAVVDPTDETRQAISKAMILARHFNSRLELFLCDAEHAFAMRHAYDVAGIPAARQKCLDSNRRYVDAVRRSLAEDVAVSTQVACDSPLYEGIVNRVIDAQPDMVVKSAAGHHSLQRFTLDANDWQLARTCPVPLMLTRGRVWNAQPRFAAAIDVSDPADDSLARTILQTAGFLALGCNAQLDILFSDANADDEEGHAARVEALHRLVGEFRVGREHIHVLRGPAEDTLPAFATRRDYDLLVLGALTRKTALAALIGTFTGRLVDSLGCDFVLVKPNPCSILRFNREKSV